MKPQSSYLPTIIRIIARLGMLAVIPVGTVVMLWQSMYLLKLWADYPGQFFFAAILFLVAHLFWIGAFWKLFSSAANFQIFYQKQDNSALLLGQKKLKTFVQWMIVWLLAALLFTLIVLSMGNK